MSKLAYFYAFVSSFQAGLAIANATHSFAISFTAGVAVWAGLLFFGTKRAWRRDVR
jgi:hypothetical protein